MREHPLSPWLRDLHAAVGECGWFHIQPVRHHPGRPPDQRLA